MIESVLLNTEPREENEFLNVDYMSAVCSVLKNDGFEME